MSRRYHMEITVTEYEGSRFFDICEAIDSLWPAAEDSGGSNETKREIVLAGEGDLSGGMSEEEFAIKVAADVMTANRKACQVQVIATYLENLPYQTFTYGEADFEHLVGTLPPIDDDEPPF